MLSQRLGMRAQEHRACLIHLPYNLLGERCLKSLPSQELVIGLASVFVGVAFILFMTFH